MARDLGDAARSVGALAHGLPDVTRDALPATLARGRQDLLDELRGPTGGDLRLSGAGPVSVTVRNPASGPGQLQARGPVRLLEDRVPAHDIAPRADGVLAGHLSHPVAGRVRHRGYPAKHVWTRAVARTVPDLGAVYAHGVSVGMAAAYRGAR
jgi:hypothetical protein